MDVSRLSKSTFVWFYRYHLFLRIRTKALHILSAIQLKFTVLHTSFFFHDHSTSSCIVHVWECVKMDQILQISFMWRGTVPRQQMWYWSTHFSGYFYSLLLTTISSVIHTRYHMWGAPCALPACTLPLPVSQSAGCPRTRHKFNCVTTSYSACFPHNDTAMIWSPPT